MLDFIQNHSLWTVPIINIFFTVLFKITAKTDKKRLTKSDWADFGFDMTVTSIMIIIVYAKDGLAFTICFWIFIAVIIVTNITRRIGTGSDNEPNWLGVIIPDLLGIISLRVATLFVGGWFS